MGLLVLYDYWVMTVDGFADAVGGDEVIRTLRPCMLKNGAAWGLKLADKYHICKGDDGIARLVTLISLIMNLEGDVMVTEGRVDKAVGPARS